MLRSIISRLLIDLSIAIVFNILLAYYYKIPNNIIVNYANKLSKEQQAELHKIALKLVEAGKGILAADESTGTIGKRFATFHIENNEQNRKNYRNLLFTTPNISLFISGIILSDETFYQKDSNGKRFVDIIKDAGIVPGIKLDKGLKQLTGTSEYITKGLDDLVERAALFRRGGCRFAKWRCVFVISQNTPSREVLQENARTLAQYSVVSQQAGLVPIIEPEVLCDGEHSIEKAGEVTELVLAEVYKSLHDHGVYLEGTLLKPNMVVPGSECTEEVSHEDIARATVQALLRTVPAAVPGIVFLSGGQSEVNASKNLNKINEIPFKKPWKLSFSYGRALQTSALKAWMMHDDKNTQAAFLHRAKLNSLAAEGRYVDEIDSD